MVEILQLMVEIQEFVIGLEFSGRSLFHDERENYMYYTSLQTFRTNVLFLQTNLPLCNKRILVAVKACTSAIGQGIRGMPGVTPLETMALMAAFYRRMAKDRELGFFTASFTPMKYQTDVQELIKDIGRHAAPVSGSRYGKITVNFLNPNNLDTPKNFILQFEQCGFIYIVMDPKALTLHYG